MNPFDLQVLQALNYSSVLYGMGSHMNSYSLAYYGEALFGSNWAGKVHHSRTGVINYYRVNMALGRLQQMGLVTSVHLPVTYSIQKKWKLTEEGEVLLCNLSPAPH